MLKHCFPIVDILTIIPLNTATNSSAPILKTKNFLGKVYSICRIYIKFLTFSKTLEPHSLSIFEIIHSEKRGYFNE